MKGSVSCYLYIIKYCYKNTAFKKKIYLFERQSLERRKQGDQVSAVWFTSHMATRAWGGPGRSLVPGTPFSLVLGGRSPSTWVVCCCFPRASAGSCIKDEEPGLEPVLYWDVGIVGGAFTQCHGASPCFC